MKFNIIAAVDRFGGIGKDGKMPWPNLSEDMRRFKALTMGCDVIMGRKTYDELRKHAGKGAAYEILPGRQITVLSKKTPTEILPENVTFIRNPAQFVPGELTGDKPVWIVGGAQIYAEYMSGASRLYITHVLGVHECDTFFPKVGVSDWEQVESLRVPGTSTTPAYRFAVYERP